MARRRSAFITSFDELHPVREVNEHVCRVHPHWKRIPNFHLFAKVPVDWIVIHMTSLSYELVADDGSGSNIGALAILSTFYFVKSKGNNNYEELLL
jgi:hypothetical protein